MECKTQPQSRKTYHELSISRGRLFLIISLIWTDKTYLCAAMERVFFVCLFVLFVFRKYRLTGIRPMSPSICLLRWRIDNDNNYSNINMISSIPLHFRFSKLVNV